MRRSFGPLAAIVLLASCTFTALDTDPNLPGVAGTTSDLARAQFAAAAIGAVRSTLESWSEAVRGQGSRALEAHYSTDAAVVQPGSDLVKGVPEIGAMAAALRERASDAHTSLLDIDVSDGIAYVYGAYDVVPLRAGEQAVRGYHVTVLRGSRDDWSIRTQVFDGIGAQAPFVATGDAPVSVIDVGTTASGRVPRQDFAAAATLVAGMARAWREADLAALQGVFGPNALLHLPDAEAAVRGGAVAGALASALEYWRSIETIELDFTASGRLAVLLGRYALSGDASERAGHYVLVAGREGDHWTIRSLLFE